MDISDSLTSTPIDAASALAAQATSDVRAGVAFVEVAAASKAYTRDGATLQVLQDVSLRIDRAEMLAVVGPSGAGKSTLLNVLGTLDLPTRGTVRFQGEDVTRYSSRKLAAFRNRTIGFVFQFHHLLPEFSALENVMMPGVIAGDPREAVAARAAELLDEVGLAGRVEHRPSELSGGEQQRVALARALVMNPMLVLADEPTGNLDSATGHAIHELMFALNRSRQTTFLVVTHNDELARRMPRVVHMRDGRVVSDERLGTETLAQAAAI